MKTKTKLRIFNVQFIATGIFWLAYTVVFTFIDGWHWKAEEGSLEAVFDSVTGLSIQICIYLFLWILYDLAVKLFEEKKPVPVNTSQLRSVEVDSHHFHAKGKFHGFKERNGVTCAIVENEYGIVNIYPIDVYSIKFTDIKENEN